MGGEAKVTVMVLKVDLQCDKCYKKVKKVLCKFTQIRDQVYDDKANTVTIRVLCCSPEKIRDKMCSKAGGSIKSIEIKDPAAKPKEAEKKPDSKPKEAEKKPDSKPKDPEKKPDNPEKKPDNPEKKPEKQKDGGDKPPKDAPKQAGDQAPKKQPEPAPVPMAAAVMTPVPSAYAAPVGCSCSDCYHSYGGGGQCFQTAYGTPVTYGRPVYDSWGSGGYYPYRAPTYGGGGEYVTEENQQGGCSIM